MTILEKKSLLRDLLKKGGRGSLGRLARALRVSYRAAQNWIAKKGEGWVPGEREEEMWEYFGYVLLPNGKVVEKRKLGPTPFSHDSSTKVTPYAQQAEKMKTFIAYLIANGVIANQEELGGKLGVDSRTIADWVTGQAEISLLVKYSLAHIYDIPESWWDQEGVAIEEVAGKGLGKDKPPQIPSATVDTAEDCIDGIEKMVKEFKKMHQTEKSQKGQGEENKV